MFTSLLALATPFARLPNSQSSRIESFFCAQATAPSRHAVGSPMSAFPVTYPISVRWLRTWPTARLSRDSGGQSQSRHQWRHGFAPKSRRPAGCIWPRKAERECTRSDACRRQWRPGSPPRVKTLTFATYSDLRDSWPGVERDAIYDDAAHLRDEDRTFLKTADTAIVFGWMEAEVRFKEFVQDARRH
jgi:hypothetical protein